VRAYTTSDEEALRARDLLKDWAGEGFLSPVQVGQMQQETVCELRRTNIFLRIVLFLFTLIIVGAAAGLFFTVLFSNPSGKIIGYFLLAFAPVCYAATEVAVSKFRLHRYGIEEALAACSVGFLCAGMHAAWFIGGRFSGTVNYLEFLVPAAGALASVWIWHRFGFGYAPLAAMIFAWWLPGYFTVSHTAQHVIVIVLYTFGLIAVVSVRAPYRFTYLNATYSAAAGMLWLGIYLALNLQLSSVNLAVQWLGGVRTFNDASEFSKPFYWATWVLIWCLPPLILTR
jgi:hypothetical protein